MKCGFISVVALLASNLVAATPITCSEVRKFSYCIGINLLFNESTLY